MSGQERTGWRDLGLSRLHKEWGYDCPAVDVDLFVEYDRKKACALIEYKHEASDPARRKSDDPNVAALIDLANLARIPFFCVLYAGDYSWFTVTPMTERAGAWLDEAVTYRQREYVEFLYVLRHRKMPRLIEDRFLAAARSTS